VDERCVQKSYWIEHTTQLSLESMMLDSNASHLDKEERPEVRVVSISPSRSLIALHFHTLIVSIIINYLLLWVKHDYTSIKFAKKIHTHYSLHILNLKLVYSLLIL